MTHGMSHPHYMVRPGVRFPDWSVVTSPTARNALLAILQVLDPDRMWRNYTPAEDRVRTTLLRVYAETGRAPAIGDLAMRSGVDAASILPILASLKARDLVVLEADGNRITGAYPFTDRDTEHLVELGDRALNAMCAIDALGVGDMYGRDVKIRSRCRSCCAPVNVTTGDRGCSLACVSPDSAVVWSGIRYEDGCAASSMCTIIAFFCSDAHLQAWRAGQHPRTPGFRLSIDEALEAGRAIFAPSLASLDAHA